MTPARIAPMMKIRLYVSYVISAPPQLPVSLYSFSLLTTDSM
jgi:hypothetical protein